MEHVSVGVDCRPIGMLLFASVTFVSAFSLCHCYRSPDPGPKRNPSYLEAVRTILDKNGKYPSLNSSTAGLSRGVIAGISIAGVVGVLLLAVCIYVGVYKKKKVQDKILLSARSERQSIQAAMAAGSTLEKATDSTGIPGSASSGLTGITVYDMGIDDKVLVEIFLEGGSEFTSVVLDVGSGFDCQPVALLPTE